MPPSTLPKGHSMTSRRARERQEASDAKHYPERWQDERDQDGEELPEREEPEPIHTMGRYTVEIVAPYHFRISAALRATHPALPPALHKQGPCACRLGGPRLVALQSPSEICQGPRLPSRMCSPCGPAKLGGRQGSSVLQHLYDYACGCDRHAIFVMQLNGHRFTFLGDAAHYRTHGDFAIDLNCYLCHFLLPPLIPGGAVCTRFRVHGVYCAV